MIFACLASTGACGSDGDLPASTGEDSGVHITSDAASGPPAEDGSTPAPNDSGQSESTYAPCSLLELSEVEAVLGAPTNAGVETGRVCKWKPANGPSSVTVQVTPDAATVYPHEKELLGVEEELSDVGDEAFRSGYIVGVRVGDQYLSVGVAPNIGTYVAKPDEVVALARSAAVRLGAR